MRLSLLDKYDVTDSDGCCLYWSGNTAKFSVIDYHGAEVSYAYFMNGINKLGLRFGISAYATNEKYDEEVDSFLQVGFQL